MAIIVPSRSRGPLLLQEPARVLQLGELGLRHVPIGAAFPSLGHVGILLGFGRFPKVGFRPFRAALARGLGYRRTVQGVRCKRRPSRSRFHAGRLPPSPHLRLDQLKPHASPKNRRGSTNRDFAIGSRFWDAAMRFRDTVSGQNESVSILSGLELIPSFGQTGIPLISNVGSPS